MGANFMGCKILELRRIWTPIGAVVLLLCTFSAFGAGLSYVDGARFARSIDFKIVPQRLDRDLNVERLLGSHEISAGEDIVVLVREFHGNPRNGTDADEFEKLTLQLSKKFIGKKITLPKKGVRGRYSRGGSSWVDVGSGWFGEHIRGTIEIQKTAAGVLTATLDIAVRVRFAQEQGETKVIRIRKTGEMSEVPIYKLSPWLGQEASSHQQAASRPD